MNKLERLVYDLLKDNPQLKAFVRDLYQRLLDVVSVKAEQSAYPVSVREGFFFGFHDHTPFSPDNRLLAAGRWDPLMPLRMPEPDNLLEVGYFSGIQFQEWHPLAQTRAWNWHQGCKLQWRGQSRILVFNDYEEWHNVARMVSIEDGKTVTLPRAIGSVSANGDRAIGYSFERVNRYMPGYGYGYKTENSELERKRPERDGMFLIDLNSGRDRLLFPIAAIAAVAPEPSMEDAFHYFSHAIFSPSSTRFVFLHRWTRGDIRRRWSRIITANLNGEEIHIFPTKDMASHLSWRNEHQLLAYCRPRDGRDGYVLFDDRDPERLAIIGQEAFRSDGHPSWSPDGRWFTTDTYPDRFRRQHLLLYDMETSTRYALGRFKTFFEFASPDPYHHWSCDLHPRFDREGRYICFDATFTGRRALCIMDFGKPLRELGNIKRLSVVCRRRS
jgi:hypothetical protein